MLDDEFNLSGSGVPRTHKFDFGLINLFAFAYSLCLLPMCLCLWNKWEKRVWLYKVQALTYPNIIKFPPQETLFSTNAFWRFLHVDKDVYVYHQNYTFFQIILNYITWMLKYMLLIQFFILKKENIFFLSFIPIFHPHTQNIRFCE